MTPNNAHILVVDDRADQRQLLTLLARRIGVGVHVVASWDEAEASLETIAFDLVLMDWQMPGIDGLEATRRLRELDQSTGSYTPVIVVTARAMSGDREACLAAGVDDYLSKPFTSKELEEKINFWLTERERKIEARV
jgi:CheY-like chemotaxis protein